MQQDQMWQAVLGEIEVSVSRASFVTWIKNTQLVDIDGDRLTIGVTNIYIKPHIVKKLNHLIKKCLSSHSVTPDHIENKINSTTRGNMHKKIYDDSIILPKQTKKPPVKSTLSHSYRQGLNEKYTFETFIVGSGNELAYAACQAIAA